MTEVLYVCTRSNLCRTSDAAAVISYNENAIPTMEPDFPAVHTTFALKHECKA